MGQLCIFGHLDETNNLEKQASGHKNKRFLPEGKFFQSNWCQRETSLDTVSKLNKKCQKKKITFQAINLFMILQHLFKSGLTSCNYKNILFL